MNAVPKTPPDIAGVAEDADQTKENSLVRVGANTAVAVIGAVSGLVILGPLGAIGGAVIGAAAAPLIRLAHEHHKSHTAT